MNSEQLPILAGALLRLRGLTLAAVFDATGIRVANLSAWLKGKPQVISAARVTALLYQVVHETPAPPSRHRPDLPAALAGMPVTCAAERM